MNIYYLNTALTYLTIGFASAIFVYYILKKKVPGRFLGAIIVGLIGSFIGGVVYQAFPDIFNFLADLNSVNVFAALFFSLAFILILAELSSYK
jgi:uncharacterized membrane protein YeaQ/YmgE (transglycosylase-associated protein family)